MGARKEIHVVRHDDGWATRSAGSSRIGHKTETQQQAIDLGRAQAIRERAELVIHRENGQIRESNSYGNDPFPPRG